MQLLWYVAAGGAAGSVVRLLLSGMVQSGTESGFPFGTLAVNISGSLLLGFILRYALETPALSPEWRALLTTGFCGGFTTFSTFSYETVALLEEGDWRRACLYVGLSLGMSLLGMVLGLVAARELLALRRSI